jgi:hypothetical protein
MATLTFFKYLRVIQVDDPVEGTFVLVQDLLNAIRDYEDELSFMDYGHIANASGKQELGGGAKVGITLELINDWRIQFESPGPQTTITCYVRGGNLVADNSYNDNPIKPSDYVTVIIAQSTSPTLIEVDSSNLLHLVESLRGRHATIGNVFYWNPDPTKGSDSNNGTVPSQAVLTFAHAKTLATAGNNDVIFALSTAAGGVTTVTERIDIDVPTLKLRGPGYPFQFAPGATGAGTPTVTISADSVEFSGFYVTTYGTGSDNGIAVTGDDALIKNVWVNSAQGNGINISGAARTRIDTCAIEDCVGKGINIGASTSLSTIIKCIITGSGGDGAYLSGTSVTDNIFENNLIYNNTGNAIDIADATVTRTGVRLHHTFAGNATPNVNDNGTDTFQDTSGTITSGDIEQIAIATADTVWDEVIGDHLTAGTTGKTLKDAKTKATLASLK